MKDVAVVLPALDEAGAVEEVVRGFARTGARVVVADNGSRDATADVARSAGAEVVHEPRRGYGRACLAGLRALSATPPAVVAFADCDGTLDPRDLMAVAGPALADEADLVLGRRARVEHGAMPVHQRVGNGAACLALRLLYDVDVHDVPPLRAIRWGFLDRLRLQEPTYGFPIETVALSARRGGRIREVDVAYRARVGRSKVTGTLAGSVAAAAVMASLTVRLRFRRLA